MSDSVLPAILSFAGIAVSGLVSWLISRSTTNKELQRLERTWQREDIVSSEDEFAEMTGCVAKYLANQLQTDYNAACKAVASIRSKETGNLGKCLDALYQELQYPIGSKEAISSRLTEVIEEKRKAKGGGQ